jgi:hypothetical protein
VRRDSLGARRTASLQDRPLYLNNLSHSLIENMTEWEWGLKQINQNWQFFKTSASFINDVNPAELTT